ncbi:MAG TPA: PqqD family protein [Polyangiales bacterium]|nr:PqqD family protein [Polyangiales bacterium]
MPCRAERTAFRVVGGEALLMVIDRRELHRLNEVGARVFELCDGSTPVSGIVASIVREFEIDTDIARSDVERFVAELGRAGALSLEPEAR